MRALAVIVFVLVTAGCAASDQSDKPLIGADKTAVVRGALTPGVHLFGEPVVARVDVVVDREKADPDAIRLKTDFEPYETVGRTEVARQDMGRYTQLRYTTTLRCLGADCIPRTARGAVTVTQLPGTPPFIPGQQRDEKRKYMFPPALVTLRAEDGEPSTTLGRVAWAPLRSLSRINWDDSSVVGQGFPFVTSVTPLPEPDYRVPPTLLGLLLLGTALALLVLPAWLVSSRLRRRRGVSAGEPRAAASPLERALALVEWASRRPSATDRREALEVLAVQLDSDDAVKAREQGWSSPPPETAAMTELVTSIRETDARST